MIKYKEVDVDAKYKDFLGIMGLCLFSWSFIISGGFSKVSELGQGDGE